MVSTHPRRGQEGYGTIHFEGKTWAVHRLSYTLTYGPIPPGKIVRHLVCNNPPCSRPDHLPLGTQWDNLHDYFAEHGQWTAAKLIPAQVSEIRHSAETDAVLSQKHKVSESEIHMIREGKRYAWVDFLRKEVIAA